MRNIKKWERPVRYDWEEENRKISREKFLYHGLSSWLGLGTWELLLYDNSRRAMMQLLQGCLEPRPINVNIPMCFIHRASMNEEEMAQANEV